MNFDERKIIYKNLQEFIYSKILFLFFFKQFCNKNLSIVNEYFKYRIIIIFHRFEKEEREKNLLYLN